MSRYSKNRDRPPMTDPVSTQSAGAPKPSTQPHRPEARRLFNASLEALPGLQRGDRQRLVACGIETTQQLYQHTCTAEGRSHLAQKLAISQRQINKWAALADLSRLPAVGCRYCGLLLHAGVASVAQLATLSLPRLHQQILKLQLLTTRQRDLCPSLPELQRWIQQARSLQRLTSPPSTPDSPPVPNRLN